MYDEFGFVIRCGLGAGVGWLFCLWILFILFYFFTFTSSFYRLCCASTHARSIRGKGGGSDQGTGTAKRQHCRGNTVQFWWVFLGGAWFGFVWDVGGVVFWFWVYFLTQSALQCINGVVRHMVRLTQVRRLKRVAEAQGYLRQACCSERLVFFFCFTHCILILYIDSSSEPKELI